MDRFRAVLGVVCLSLLASCRGERVASVAIHAAQPQAVTASTELDGTALSTSSLPQQEPNPATLTPPTQTQTVPPVVVPDGASSCDPCNGPFISGINVAWAQFAADIGTGRPDLVALRRQFALLAGAGGKVARLWLHTDGTVTPEFTGKHVSGPGLYAIADLQQILNLAQVEGVQLMLTLWSFDMVRSDLKRGNPTAVERNHLLFSDSAALTAYLDLALTPMVLAVVDHPALYAWDVFNEPEGMTATEHWGQVAPADRISHLQIQIFINRVAGRIRKLAPHTPITAGAVSFKYLSQRVGLGNFYSDDSLIAAGGDPLGTLDFYQVHHYDQMGKEYSPFLHHVNYFTVDKPVLVGEFAMQEYLEHAVESPRQLYAKLRTLGYMGALGWKDGRMLALNLMLNAIVYLQFPADVGTDPELCWHFAGGYGAPFFDGETLFRLKTAEADPTDKALRCIVE